MERCHYLKRCLNVNLKKLVGHHLWKISVPSMSSFMMIKRFKYVVAVNSVERPLARRSTYNYSFGTRFETCGSSETETTRWIKLIETRNLARQEVYGKSKVFSALRHIFAWMEFANIQIYRIQSSKNCSKRQLVISAGRGTYAYYNFLKTCASVHENIIGRMMENEKKGICLSCNEFWSIPKFKKYNF